MNRMILRYVALLLAICRGGYSAVIFHCFIGNNMDHPVHNALERLHYFYSTQSCDMSHADVAHIPTDKSVQLLITYFREYKSQQNTSQTHSLHIPKYFYDPITYYIYGLRKIVI